MKPFKSYQRLSRLLVTSVLYLSSQALYASQCGQACHTPPASVKVTLTHNTSPTTSNFFGETEISDSYNKTITGVSVQPGWSVYIYDQWQFETGHTCYKKTCYDSSNDGGALYLKPETVIVRNHSCRRLLIAGSSQQDQKDIYRTMHPTPLWKKLLNMASLPGPSEGVGVAIEEGEGFALPESNGEWFPNAEIAEGIEPANPPELPEVPAGNEASSPEMRESIIQEGLGQAETAYNHYEGEGVELFTLRSNSRDRPKTFSADGKYGLGDVNSERIWVRDDATPPVAASHPGKLRVWNRSNNGKYLEFQSAEEYMADCCHTAEEIMVGEELEFGMEDQTEVAGTNYVWGSDQPAKQALVVSYGRSNPGSVNNSANPRVGQAYAILRNGAAAEGESPFHVAAVVARDGSTTITMEVSASQFDAVDRDTQPEFYMYTTDANDNSGLQTFHETFATNEGYGTDATTVVIEPITDPNGGRPGGRRDLRVPYHQWIND
jgi:hypothetical protein